MKKLSALILITILLLWVLAACGNNKVNPLADQFLIPDYSLKYAELNPDDNIMTESANKFAELVMTKSKGRIVIEVFPDGRLGNEKIMYKALQTGAGDIDIARGSISALEEFGAKKLAIFDLPFIFRDRDHLWKALNSPIGEEFLKEPQETGSGMVGLFYLDEGSRYFFTREDIKIGSLADFKGLKLRMPATDIMSDTAVALGVQSIPIDFPELYSALRSGIVQGAEQSLADYYANKFYEVAPNLSLTCHSYSPSIVLMSEAVWNKLDMAAQNIIIEAARETELWNKSSAEELDASLKKDIIDAGSGIIDISDRVPFTEATKGVVMKYAADYTDYYSEIINM